MTVLRGTAPDGTPVRITVDETGLRPVCDASDDDAWLCTRIAGHPGPWHIADTGAEIVRVWHV